ncbi:solanesyl-diphosphate synthase 1, mitochondrial-like [Chenopodium quinoa]|uniref:solanesyl-diphosphate synthase 1, mitochondrial-like n=1 Tax=Chenopodium quinoa TaxID=63459 RepID=UPI000B776E41|nr:solanesyl-diphosphate synthase 1, mitochondrial-like [Chenopodium quinoa]
MEMVIKFEVTYWLSHLSTKRKANLSNATIVIRSVTRKKIVGIRENLNASTIKFGYIAKNCRFQNDEQEFMEQLAVLAGDLLLSRACVALASLQNNEVVSLIAEVVQHLVTGETMQMTTSSEQRLNMQYYMEKTYYKTASLISNSCKSIALLAGHSTEAAMLSYEYGKNLGLAFQLIDDVLDFTGTSASLGKGSLSDIRHGIITAPLLFATEEFPRLGEVVQRGLDNPADVDLALDYLGRSQGIQRAKDLALKHANLAAAAIDSLPESDDDDVRRSRQALIDLTLRVINRTK